MLLVGASTALSSEDYMFKQCSPSQDAPSGICTEHEVLMLGALTSLTIIVSMCDIASSIVLLLKQRNTAQRMAKEEQRQVELNRNVFDIEGELLPRR